MPTRPFHFANPAPSFRGHVESHFISLPDDPTRLNEFHLKDYSVQILPFHLTNFFAIITIVVTDQVIDSEDLHQDFNPVTALRTL